MAVALALCAGFAVGDDDLDAYLARPGLEPLLAVHLEERLQAAREQSERQAIAQRLALVFGTLLDGAGDAAEIESLERRAEALLQFVTGADADELRLALAAARHRNAARTLERHRLRSATDEEVQAARDALGRMLPELDRLERALAAALEDARQRLARSGGVEATVQAERTSRLERLAAQAAFLRGWSLYYEAMVGLERAKADQAIALFARVLDLPEGTSRADDVSRSLMERESYARTALGMALAQGLLRSEQAAAEWLELLADEMTHPAVRDEAPAWHLAVLLDTDPPVYGRAEALLDALLERTDPVPVAWLKLAAARGLEGVVAQRSPAQSTAAQSLAAKAVASLAVRGEIAHVLDLARRFGGASLGDDGFVLRYVRGIERFETARERHGDDEPTSDPQVRALYDEAATELEAALNVPDTSGRRDGVAACRHLLAWTHYYRGRMLAAARLFGEAAELQRPVDAAESRWMAIVALDRHVREDTGDAETRRALEGAIALFLREHPNSPRAGRLVLRSALVAEPSRETLERLLAIPEGSDAHVGAQRQALHVLYRMIRESRDDDERAELSREFILRALPLLEDDERRIDEGDETLRDGRIVRLRQAIEVSLTPQVNRPSLARDLLDRLDEQQVAAERHAAEIAMRRVQVAAAEDDLVAAERWAEVLRGRVDDAGAREWFVTAARVVFRIALLQWQAAGGEDLAGPLAAIDRWGSAVIAAPLALEDPQERRRALADRLVLPYLTGTAEAVVRQWRLSRDPAAAERAESLLRHVLEIREDDQSAVRWLSILLDETGRLDDALALVRRLVAGTAKATEPWFEARYRQIDLLRRIDPARARSVMEQHRALHPEYGPEPWGDRLRRLDERLQIERPPSAPGGGIDA